MGPILVAPAGRPDAEFGLLEVLDTGNSRCKSTLHMAPAGGSSYYFNRVSCFPNSLHFQKESMRLFDLPEIIADAPKVLQPEKGTIKAAVLFLGSKEMVHIQLIDNSQSFDKSLTTDVIHGFTKQTGTGYDFSLFKLGG